MNISSLTLFFVFFLSCGVFFNLVSLRDYKTFSRIYKSLPKLKFHKVDGLLIANEKTKDEFIIFGDYNYKVYDGGEYLNNIHLELDLKCPIKNNYN